MVQKNDFENVKKNKTGKNFIFAFLIKILVKHRISHFLTIPPCKFNPCLPFLEKMFHPHPY